MSHAHGRKRRAARAAATAALAGVAAVLAAEASRALGLPDSAAAAGVAVAALGGAAPFLRLRPRRRAAAAAAPATTVEAASPEAATPQPGVAAVAPSPEGPIRVLVAEDSAVNQLIARAMLERVGCVVEVVSDGDAAVAAALSRRFDVVLMDLSMPGRSGIEATAAIRRAEAGGRRRTAIVAVTAFALREHRARCLEAGMDDHLAKPYTPEALAAAVEKWARRPVGPARSLATG
jgi:CheY-like chemotaxis protein